MADMEENTGSAAAAQAEKPERVNKPVSSQSALRRKVVGRSQTSLSSPAKIVLPGEALAASAPSVKLAPIPRVEGASSTPESVDASVEATPVETAPAQPKSQEPAPLSSPVKRKAGRPRKIVDGTANLAGIKPPPVKRVAVKPIAAKPTVTKPMPIEPATPKPTHAKLPALAATASAPKAPAGSGAARPPLRAPRIIKPVSNSHTNPSPAFSIKDLTMDMSANFSGFQDAMGQAQAKAQAAFEKSSSMLGEAGDFAKGNVEAMIESSKIFADGVQEMGGTLVAEGRTAFESMTGDIKELAAAKSPTDFLKLQSDLVRKSFDSAVAYSSKNSETFLKLMSDAFAPLSGRVSLAVEKARQTAPLGASLNTAV
jgi:phasin family protein